MSQMTIIDGWLVGADKRPSPHFNARPSGVPVDLLVIHNISLPPGQFGSDDVSDFFLGRLDSSKHPFFKQIEAMKVSAHCLLRRDGQIVQYVSFDDRAWHAGISSFEGKEGCNDYSIGIEVEGTDELPYTDRQYDVLAVLTMTLMQTYTKIARDRIVGHCDIAPGRKTDPGKAFDWARFNDSLT